MGLDDRKVNKYASNDAMCDGSDIITSDAVLNNVITRKNLCYAKAEEIDKFCLRKIDKMLKILPRMFVPPSHYTLSPTLTFSFSLFLSHSLFLPLFLRTLPFFFVFEFSLF